MWKTLNINCHQSINTTRIISGIYLDISNYKKKCFVHFSNFFSISVSKYHNGLSVINFPNCWRHFYTKCVHWEIWEIYNFGMYDNSIRFGACHVLTEISKMKSLKQVLNLPKLSFAWASFIIYPLLTFFVGFGDYEKTISMAT